MALYLGNSEKLKIYLGDTAYHLNIYSSVINIIKLLSSDGFVLLDENGLYLIPKEE